MGNVILSIELLAGNMIDDGGNVLFDQVAYTEGNIGYDGSTGIITIGEAGQYIINWWIASQSSLSAVGAAFAIQSSQGDVLIGASPTKTGNVTGVSVINVAEVPVTVSLSNVSAASFYYSSVVPVKASLAISKINSAEAGAEIIIPFASGLYELYMTTGPDGTIGYPAFVGFGSNTGSTEVYSTTIDLRGTLSNPMYSFAFCLPRNGTITAINAFFSLYRTEGASPGDYQIHAQLFRSEVPDTDILHALPETDIALTPTLTGPDIPFRSVATGSVDVNIPVTRGERLLLVFFTVPPASAPETFLSGDISAGVSIR